MHDDDRLDDLDRALFSLPLEEPPPDLRSAILAATTRAERRVPFAGWEFGLLGGTLALVAWFGLILQSDFDEVTSRIESLVASVQPFGSFDAALWLAVGVAISAASLARFGLARRVDA